MVSYSGTDFIIFFFTGEDRGPVLEVIVSRTNYICSHTNKILRVIGLSTALANAKDLADWLGIGQVNSISFPFIKTFFHPYLYLYAGKNF